MVTKQRFDPSPTIATEVGLETAVSDPIEHDASQ